MDLTSLLTTPISSTTTSLRVPNALLTALSCALSLSCSARDSSRSLRIAATSALSSANSRNCIRGFLDRASIAVVTVFAITHR